MDFPFETAERTQFSDEGYGVLGRALAFATDFEGNCKAFASLIELKNEPSIITDENSLNEFCKFIGKKNLFVHLKTISEKLQFPEETNEVLQKGRKARNYIAHEAGLGLKYIMKNETKRKLLLSNIKKSVNEMAEANLIILFLLNVVTNEPNPTSKYLQNYVDSSMRWVCEEK